MGERQCRELEVGEGWELVTQVPAQQMQYNKMLENLQQ